MIFRKEITPPLRTAQGQATSFIHCCIKLFFYFSYFFASLCLVSSNVDTCSELSILFRISAKKEQSSLVTVVSCPSYNPHIPRSFLLSSSSMLFPNFYYISLSQTIVNFLASQDHRYANLIASALNFGSPSKHIVQTPEPAILFLMLIFETDIEFEYIARPHLYYVEFSSLSNLIPPSLEKSVRSFSWWFSSFIYIYIYREVAK